MDPLTFALQDFDSASPMALDDHGSNPWLNSGDILHDCRFISPDSIPRPADSVTGNPSEKETLIADADTEFDENPWNFCVWDLNTANPELEIGTLAEMLTSILAQTEDCMSYDALDLFGGRSPSVDAFDFRDMKSALEERNVDRLSEILGRLGISGRDSKA